MPKYVNIYKTYIKMSKPQLVLILKLLKYKNLHRHKKSELVKMIIFDKILKILQRKFRKKFFLETNYIDLISYDTLAYPLWNKSITNGRRYYNLNTIISHLIINRGQKDGPIDPLTCLKYTPKEISELNYLYKYYNYDKIYKYPTLYIALKDIDSATQKNYENERIEVLKDFILSTFDIVMEEFISFYIKEQNEFIDITDKEENDIKKSIIDILKDIYNYFYWLRPLDNFWFEATFKLLYQKIELNIQLERYPPKEHFLYSIIFETLDSVKEFCNTNYIEEDG